MGILETLRSGISQGELIGLIEQGKCNQHLAWLSVFQGIAEEYTEHPSSQSPLVVVEGDKRLILLSDITLKFNPAQTTLGRVGFHLPDIFQIPQEHAYTNCSPQEIHIGEYDIKRAFERFPELAVYARLIDSYPQR